MKYNNLIIFLTDRCMSGCATCNVKASPENSGMVLHDDLDLIFENSLLAESVSKYVIWTGGEPFENFSSLIYGIGQAERSGFNSEILTAGYWYEEGASHLTELKKAGNFSLRISIDQEHLRFSGTEKIIDLLSECIDMGIEANFTVRKIGDEQDCRLIFFDEIKRSFPDHYREKTGDPRWIHQIPHVPISKDDPYLNYNKEVYKNSGCKMAGRDLVVGWDGNIYPCCGLFSLPGFKKYATGNIRGTDFIKNKHIKSNELFKLIREGGPGELTKKFGPEDIDMEI
ncbi:MAG: hypothetical protein KAR14_14665, partial [Candidatus Aminicenantes bacterium]|nr:hypothetical protein [Candidatus Aminicenantes bacterium]